MRREGVGVDPDSCTMQGQMDRLANGNNRLESLVDRLRERLSPVLLDMPVGGEALLDRPQPSMTSHTARLDTIANTFESTLRALDHVIDRIEV